MDNSQERYDQLLALIEAPFDNSHPMFYVPTPIIDDNGYYHGISVTFHKNNFEINMSDELQKIIIDILKSGIFRDGKLRGRKITSVYRVYSIIDLERTVITAAEYIDYAIKAKEKNPLFNKFEWHLVEINNSLDTISEIIEELASSRLRKSLQKIRDELSKLSTDTKKKMPPTSNFTSLDSLIRLLKEKIPDAPDLTLSARLRELLKKFGFDIKEETIRKRLQSI